MEVFKVGGFVRDTLLGKNPKDIDYVVIGSSPDEMLAQGFSQVGADFPVFLHPETKDEYALARTERKVGAGYHGFETDFSKEVTLEEDLIRRDLTINSMAMDEDGNVVDPFNAQEDLKNGILRHTSVAFKEDPLRVLRLARFKARYNFDVHNDTTVLVAQMKVEGVLDELQPDRVIEEMKKGMTENTPSIMFKFIRDYKICEWMEFENNNFKIALEKLDECPSTFSVEEKLIVFFFFSNLSKDEMREFKFPKFVFETIHKLRVLQKRFDKDEFIILRNFKESGMLNLGRNFPNVFNVLKVIVNDDEFVNTLEKVVKGINSIKFNKDDFKGVSPDAIKEHVNDKHTEVLKEHLNN